MSASRQNEKSLLSVIRGLVGMFPKHQKTFFFFLKQQNAKLAQKSYQFMLH
ncbi:hypothetical protein HPPN135_06390 [Helicobacter pylori Puno135]|nr:hypothetical protein HPPN135_06390 [Helicobacter pylori Puno135]